MVCLAAQKQVVRARIAIACTCLLVYIYVPSFSMPMFSTPSASVMANRGAADVS